MFTIHLLTFKIKYILISIVFVFRLIKNTTKTQQNKSLKTKNYNSIN